MTKALLLFLGICFLLVGCSSLNETTRLQEEHSSKADVEYSIIYIIHGDSNYLFHKDGERYQADEEVLKEAFSVAAGATNGEVFIFHQKPERNAFFFFPKKDRVFYHFKNGLLVSKSRYSPKNGGLSAEVSHFNTNVSSSSNRTFLAYFGHEIPLKNGGRYHRTIKDDPFNVPVFIEGLEEINKKLDLVVLSVCNGGNPYLIDQLSSLSEATVTSPQNLHLSHLKTSELNLLERNPAISSVELANSIAKESFEELTSFVQTEITIAAYSMKEVKKYSPGLSHLYEQKLSTSTEEELLGDNRDCINIQNYTSVLRSGGVTSYYKSSSFGRNAAKKEHSGWGCKR